NNRRATALILSRVSMPSERLIFEVDM
ncbi:MAG: hypothetical protein JWP58_4587, partial [Hymenobacter sp.]|nr:hypothetical protein [Hymenobacter sp.]